MDYSPAAKVSILKRVLPPNNESINKVSVEMGINDQTIRNWIKTVTDDDEMQEKSMPCFMKAEEKYLLLKEAIGIAQKDKGSFL